MMTKVVMELKVTRRCWCGVMLAIGAIAIQLGADEEKICTWVVKYGIKIESIGS